MMDRFWKYFGASIVGAFALMFLARIALDGYIEYKAAPDSPKTIDPTVISCRMVKPWNRARRKHSTN